MKPSVSRSVLKKQSQNIKTYNKRIVCPYGTVPILRNSKNYNNTEKYFHPLSVGNPGTHIAGVMASGTAFRGVEGWFDANNLKVGKDQATYSQIYIGKKLYNRVNFIHAGFMIKPSHYGDGRVWSYGFWKGKDGKGCYNTACSGFVQVSHEVPIVEPIEIRSGKPSWLQCSIHQDKNTGNWWITLLSNPNVDIGYWPKELFDILADGANIVRAGGVVQASNSGSSPPMGNGKFPNVGVKDSAIFTNVGVLDDTYALHRMDSFTAMEVVDSYKCYKLRRRPFYRDFGFYFNYGGPGGNSCGV
ncbi:unnamed protein product [Cochlearia groenlandica]